MKAAVEIAQSLAKEYHNEFFYPAHLLRAMMHKDVGLKDFIDSIGKDSGYVMEWAEVRMEDIPKVAKTKENIKGDDGIKQVFDEADNIRIKLGLDTISPICALVAISKPGSCF
jgi:ATP-dependent Clp protease ATP-binding subunit ClpA